MGMTAGDIFGGGDFHAQDTIECAPHRSIRFDAGNPYQEKWALRRCSDARPPVLVVPAKGSRFRFGNSSAFPNRRHGDHWRR